MTHPIPDDELLAELQNDPTGKGYAVNGEFRSAKEITGLLGAMQFSENTEERGPASSIRGS